jgi:hypothetical protein
VQGLCAGVAGALLAAVGLAAGWLMGGEGVRA